MHFDHDSISYRTLPDVEHVFKAVSIHNIVTSERSNFTCLLDLLTFTVQLTGQMIS